VIHAIPQANTAVQFASMISYHMQRHPDQQRPKSRYKAFSSRLAQQKIFSGSDQCRLSAGRSMAGLMSSG
jgi:hypothetical protein